MTVTKIPDQSQSMLFHRQIREVTISISAFMGNYRPSVTCQEVHLGFNTVYLGIVW